MAEQTTPPTPPTPPPSTPSTPGPTQTPDLGSPPLTQQQQDLEAEIQQQGARHRFALRNSRWARRPPRPPLRAAPGRAAPRTRHVE